MSVLHFGILAAGLSAVAIPILIHLLMRRRRKPVFWGAMRFLEEAVRRTRRRLLIERWLLLATRCALVALIAVALGRPLLDALAPGTRGGLTVILLIDNGVAAHAQYAGPALDRHRAVASRVLGELRDGDRVGVVTLANPAAALALPPTANLAAAAALVESIEATDARADLAGGLTLAANTITAGGESAPPPDRTLVVLVSDLLAGTADTESTLPRLPAGVRMVVAAPPAEEPPANIAVRSVRAVRSVLLSGRGEAGEAVAVTLSRSGRVEREQATTVSVRLESAGRGDAAGPAAAVPATGLVRWSPGQRDATANLVLDAPPASASQAAVLVATIDPDALPADNTFRLPVEVREVLRVGVIAGPRAGGSGPESLTTAQWLRLGLRPREDASIEVVDLDAAALDPATLAGLDAVAVADPSRLTEADWPRLKQFARGLGASPGGLVVVFPPADRTVHTWTDAMARGLDVPVELARETRTLAADGEAAPRLAPEAPTAADAPGAGDLLAPIRGELPDLAPPVEIRRVLPVAVAREGVQAQLALADGTGVVWTLTGGKAAGAAGSAAGSANAASAVDGPARGGGGAIVYVAFALDLAWTDLPVKPLAVPLLQELFRQGVGRARPGAWALAGARLEAPAQAVRLVPWAGAGTESDALTLTESGGTAEPVRGAGVWDALDARGGRRGVLAVNADTAGSSLDRVDLTAVQNWLAGATQTAGGARGTPSLAWLAAGNTANLPTEARKAERIDAAIDVPAAARAAGPSLLWLVLALAVAEVVLARRASHAASVFAPATPGGSAPAPA